MKNVIFPINKKLKNLVRKFVFEDTFQCCFKVSRNITFNIVFKLLQMSEILQKKISSAKVKKKKI